MLTAHFHVCRGARINSDSWGTGSATYDAYAYDVDVFAWYYQNFLPLYAAGNFGYEAVDSTISSPAVAKNCLAVGEPLCLHFGFPHLPHVVVASL